MAGKITELNASEREWVSAHVAATRALINESVHSLRDEEPIDLDALDTIWTRWLDQTSVELADVNGMINMLGLALGQALVERLGLEWKVVQDEHSTEIAVHGAVGDITIHPTNLVAKRYETRTPRFFADIARWLEAEVSRVRDAHRAH